MSSRWMRTLAGTVALLAVLGGAGCQMNRKAQTVAVTGIDQSGETASAPLAIDIENSSGTVIVRVDPKASGPRVLARPADGRRVRKTDKPWAAAELAMQDEHRVLRVSAGGGEGPAEPVIITVVVPACEGIRVKNAGGPVQLRGVGGAITVTNADLGGRTAAIEVETRRDLTMPVSLISTGGDVTCIAGPGTVGKVTLNTPDGMPEVRAKSAAMVREGQNTATGWSAEFGRSENTITLTTDHGRAVFELR